MRHALSNTGGKEHPLQTSLFKALTDFNGTSVNIRTRDGIADCYLFHPADQGPWQAVILYMDALGIRPEFFDMARRLADGGYYVLLPNLFYRTPDFVPFEGSADLTQEGPGRDRLMAAIRSVSNGMIMQDTAAFLDFLGRQPRVSGKVGCVGYCMSGPFALSAAGTFPDRVAAAASIHGSNLATQRPDSPHLLAKKIRGELYIAVAELDTGFSTEEKKRLEEALKNAGVRHTLEVYPGTLHGFAVKNRPVYDRAASERHWERILRLFRENL